MKLALFSTALLASGLASAATPVNGWYSSVFGGYAYIPGYTSRFDSGFFFSDTAYRNGFNVGGRLGYQSNPIRYEIEYTYLQANTKKFDVFLIPQTGVSGNTHANIGMANIYYDFADVILPTISPFLGVGIGYAYIQNSLESSGPFDAIFFKQNNGVFAYQGTAGLTYNFAENFALNASYRYLATSSSNTFGKTFQSQMGDVGIVYRFDQCDYK
ncbi:outer membrane protein [Legionella cincinnatiensis]|uniref:Opacity protein-like surface antigen n=1 Tax=Legionella cincinnatiensis TaxID=28085 RepID=A0A378INJ3_9GAMM|nr:outer membrane beta-barrel protein [Legionella cincinnatiensis]KTC88471.1 opacity protein-like surface antigen [Legionella cincinnatiensis]STX36041.1 opacity protein-like surface antigen [Legionella cincinnatiensis]